MRLFILIGSGCLDLAPFMFRVVGGVFELSLGHFKPKFISSKAHYHIPYSDALLAPSDAFSGPLKSREAACVWQKWAVNLSA